MERKLELKEIAVYFPYKLKIICSITKAHTLFGYYKTFNQQWEEWAVVNNPDEKSQTSDILFDDITPILRPLSDLYLQITHNRKEIVPLIECAKIVHPLNNWIIEQDDDCNDNYSCFCGCFEFLFNHRSMSFLMWNGDDYIPVGKQYQLFDYLHELKIDYRGLIDVGLAIDANTLENNPYK